MLKSSSLVDGRSSGRVDRQLVHLAAGQRRVARYDTPLPENQRMPEARQANPAGRGRHPEPVASEAWTNVSHGLPRTGPGPKNAAWPCRSIRSLGDPLVHPAAELAEAARTVRATREVAPVHSPASCRPTRSTTARAWDRGAARRRLRDRRRTGAIARAREKIRFAQPTSSRRANVRSAVPVLAFSSAGCRQRRRAGRHSKGGRLLERTAAVTRS